MRKRKGGERHVLFSQKTDILIGMAAGIAVGALAATCTCVGTDRKKMKKIKTGAMRAFKQMSDKLARFM